MNKETIRYIIVYFSRLMTEIERKVMRHSQSLIKLNYDISENSSSANLYYKHGWLSKDSEVLDLLNEGYEAFELNLAQRIMREASEKVYFNNCPKCGQLARTPYARQCRCGYQWHHIIQAQFHLESAFQITGRGFFLIGKLIKGEVKQGNYIDLTPFGLNSKPTIERIEFVLKKQDNKVWEDFGLGINELTDEQKDYIKKVGSFYSPLDILNER